MPVLERGPPPRDGGSPTTQVADEARRYAGRAARFLADVRYAAKPSPPKPTSIIAQVEGSGTAKGMKSSPCGAPEPSPLKSVVVEMGFRDVDADGVVLHLFHASACHSGLSPGHPSSPKEKTRAIQL